MSFPSGTPVVTLTGTLPAAVAGDGFGGRVVLTPSAILTDTARHAIYPGGGQVDIVDGVFEVDLIPNNADGIEPDGWMWQVDVQPAGGRRATFWADIHGADGATVHLDSLVPAQAPGGGNAGGNGADGADGKSAYELAVENGFSGNVSQWLASLVGPAGATGATGPAGTAGATGAQGSKGDTGSQGPTGVTGATGATGTQGPKGDPGDPATNLVTSVNGKQGVVVLSASDVSADASGAAASAQSAATSAAASDATSKVTAHTGAADPHGDRAFTTSAVTAHAAAVDPHGDRAYTDTQTATRVPTSRQITTGTGLTGGGSLGADRTLAVSFGTSGTTATVGNDSRLSDARTPTAHAASHASGGSDPVTLAQAQVTGLAAALAAALPLAGGTMTGTTNATLPSANSIWTAALASGDAFDRIRTYLDRIEFGPGAATRDTILRRLGVGQLGTDGAFTVGGALKTSGAMTWRRRHLPDPVVVDSLYAGAAPTISTAQTGTPTSGYIKYAPAGVTLAGSDVTGPFTYLGAGNMTIGTGTPDSGSVLPTSRYPNTRTTNASSQSVWSLEFGTDAQTFQLRFNYQTAGVYRLSIDGRKVTDLLQAVGGTTAGSTHLMSVDLGSAAPRTIRFDFYTVPFAGIYLPPTATMWSTVPNGGRFMVFGDSLSDGSAQNTGGGGGTWVHRAARLLGSNDCWDEARGGTGYITPGSFATLADRVNTDVIAWNPNRLVIWAGYNDNGGNQTTIGTAASALYAAIKAGLPDCETYVIGCWSPSGTPATSISNTDATLRTAAAGAGLPFISPLTGSCYDSTGTLVATHGAFITAANAAGYVGADAIHPTDAGHIYLSRRITAAIKQLMPA